VLLLVSVAACDTGVGSPSRTPHATASDAVHTALAIVLRTQEPIPSGETVRPCPAAQTSGELAADDVEGLVLVEPYGLRRPIIWPYGYSAREKDGRIELPTPEHGGSLDALRPFLNVADDDQWRLLVGYLLGCYHPSGPYPVLAVHGEQGTAKSTAMRVIRRLVDPRDALDRAEPRSEWDLAVHAARHRVIALDNLSSLSEWLSDALARLATGAGFSVRKLYSDDEEVTFHARRPVMLNGIGTIIERSDLLDRALLVNLDTIPPERRREEGEFWSAFDAAAPAILGALLDAVSMALARRSSVELASLPRMADFARWVTAAEPALGWRPGAFLRSCLIVTGWSSQPKVTMWSLTAARLDQTDLGWRVVRRRCPVGDVLALPSADERAGGIRR
jgi:hypothetical protein